MKLLVHNFLSASYANGPGCRAVLWIQGCSHRCPGCFNERTHGTNGGRWISIRVLVAWLIKLVGSIDGLTISGGEPLQQLTALTEFLRQLRARTPLSVILLTGYSWAEIEEMVQPIPTARQAIPNDPTNDSPSNPAHDLVSPTSDNFLNYVDVVNAGRYRQQQHLAHGLRGSANKTLHFLTNRYTPRDIAEVPCAEIVITPKGHVMLSGVDPLVQKGEVVP